MGKKFVCPEGVSYDHESEYVAWNDLSTMKGVTNLTRQVKYVLPSRFFRSHSWKSDFEFDYKKKHWVIDLKGWFRVEDRVKLSFVEYVHKIEIVVVPYKTKQIKGVKHYTIDWSFLNE